MFAYVFSPEAVQDLEDVWDFIAADNVGAADRLQDEFFEAFEELARHPGLGHTRRDLTDKDVRFWPVGSYFVVYRKISSQVQIVAVLHGSRDIPEIIRKR
jgi:plasmid stabilization system protein ParE